MPEKLRILYEDKFLVVVYKPENMLTVPYPGSRARTAIDVLTEIRRKRGLVHGNYRPAAVHRLDKETSGVMMFALTPECQRIVMDGWQNIVKHRYYVALAETPNVPARSGGASFGTVAGRSANSGFAGQRSSGSKASAPETRKTELRAETPNTTKSGAAELLPDEGVIDLPLTKNAMHHSYVADTTRGGKPQKNEVQAVTHYKVLKKDRKYTLFQLELETGRTNQIRAHLSAKKYPIAGDKQYRARTDPFHRLCLHARSLEFVHPYTHETLSFEVPEPDSWGKLIHSV